MNSDIERVSEEMKRQIFSLLMPLQSERRVDEQAFAAVDKSSRELAALLKGSELLPRALINELYVAAKTLMAEAQYAKDATLVQQKASTLYMTFDLILCGEAYEDRQPGVPRII